MKVEDIDIPEIQEDEVLVRVKSAAVCGTDIRIYGNGMEGIDENHPRILGHEISGIIEKTGCNVPKYKKGMHIAVAPNMGCGICDICVSGRTHMCREYGALGINIDGGFAEYMKIPKASVAQGNIVELEDSISFEEAAVIEPLSCVYNGSLQYKMLPGDVILIIGAGPIGILHAKMAKMAGARTVIIHDISLKRLEICKSIDPSFVIIEKDLKENIFKLTNGNGVDVCITACPSPKAQSDALELMAVGGRVNFFGGLPQGREIVPINTNIIHYKQLVLTGNTRASISQYRKTLQLVTSGIINVKDIITNRFSLERIEEAFQMTADASGLKTVINFD